MPKASAQPFYCEISYEGCSIEKLEAVFDKICEEHFDGSHVDGSQTYIAVVDGTDKKAIERRIQNAVWGVNGGLFCSVRFLTEEQFDDYC